jgi:hypothetical protein
VKNATGIDPPSGHYNVDNWWKTTNEHFEFVRVDSSARLDNSGARPGDILLWSDVPSNVGKTKHVNIYMGGNAALGGNEYDGGNGTIKRYEDYVNDIPADSRVKYLVGYVRVK